jgi:hypothetical protein
VLYSRQLHRAGGEGRDWTNLRSDELETRELPPGLVLDDLVDLRVLLLESLVECGVLHSPHHNEGPIGQLVFKNEEWRGGKVGKKAAQTEKGPHEIGGDGDGGGRHGSEGGSGGDDGLGGDTGGEGAKEGTSGIHGRCGRGGRIEIARFARWQVPLVAFSAPISNFPSVLFVNTSDLSQRPINRILTFLVRASSCARSRKAAIYEL